MGWHGKWSNRAAPDGEGEVIDHFSIADLNKYLSRFDQAFGSMELSGLRAFFNDSYEVDDAIGESNWTEDFLSSSNPAGSTIENPFASFIESSQRRLYLEHSL